MSATTGTATDYLDLLAKFRAFVTTDSALVAAGQNWTELKTNSTPYNVVDNTQTNTVEFETYLKAPGLSTTESIYMQLQAYQNVSANIFNWRLRGAAGFLTGSDWFHQPNPSPDAYAYLWDQPITYWFIVNGQRAIIIAKISTVYESMYIGKFLPYGTPSQYPYPLLIGGGGFQGAGGNVANLRFSDTSPSHRAFFDPQGVYYCHPDSSWQALSNWTGVSQNNQNVIWPWQTNITRGQRGAFMATDLDGTYTVFPSRFNNNTPSNNVLGEFDGVGMVTGFSNASENALTIGSDSWIVFQDTFRTALDNFCAVKFA
jgi:hypothetical protein